MAYPYKYGFPVHPSGTYHAGVKIPVTVDPRSVASYLEELGADIQLFNYLPTYRVIYIYTTIPAPAILTIPGVIGITDMKVSPFTKSLI